MGACRKRSGVGKGIFCRIYCRKLREARMDRRTKFPPSNFAIVPGGSVDHLRAAATELVSLRPDVILAMTSVAARLVAEQTQSIPIVFLLSIDPIAEGPRREACGAPWRQYHRFYPSLTLTWEANGCNCSRRSPGDFARRDLMSPFSPLGPSESGGATAADRALGLGISVRCQDGNPMEIEGEFSGHWRKTHQALIWSPPNALSSAHRASALARPCDAPSCQRFDLRLHVRGRRSHRL